MDKPNQLETSFIHLVQQQIEDTRVLMDTLVQEQVVLQGTKPESLQQITQQKQQQLEKLEADIKQHNQFLEQLELTPDRQGVEDFLATLPENTPAWQYWHELQTWLDACQKQNTINGGMLALSQRQVTNALDLLRGITHGQKTYGPSGESRSGLVSNSLGMA